MTPTIQRLYCHSELWYSILPIHNSKQPYLGSLLAWTECSTLSTLLKVGQSKDQTELLHACRSIRIVYSVLLPLSLFMRAYRTFLFLCSHVFFLPPLNFCYSRFLIISMTLYNYQIEDSSFINSVKFFESAKYLQRYGILLIISSLISMLRFIRHLIISGNLHEFSWDFFFTIYHHL